MCGIWASSTSVHTSFGIVDIVLVHTEGWLYAVDDGQSADGTGRAVGGEPFVDACLVKYVTAAQPAIKTTLLIVADRARRRCGCIYFFYAARNKNLRGRRGAEVCLGGGAREGHLEGLVLHGGNLLFHECLEQLCEVEGAIKHRQNLLFDFEIQGFVHSGK